MQSLAFCFLVAWKMSSAKIGKQNVKCFQSIVRWFCYFTQRENFYNFQFVLVYKKISSVVYLFFIPFSLNYDVIFFILLYYFFSPSTWFSETIYLVSSWSNNAAWYAMRPALSSWSYFSCMLRLELLNFVMKHKTFFI